MFSPKTVATNKVLEKVGNLHTMYMVSVQYLLTLCLKISINFQKEIYYELKNNIVNTE